MSLRRFLNVVSYIIAPTHEAQENLNNQLDALSDKETWGMSAHAQQGVEAFMGLNT